MRVLGDATIPLTDAEVLQLLQRRAALPSSGAPPPPTRSTSAAEAYVAFAASTPASTQTLAAVEALTTALRGWDLTAPEIVQLVNLRVVSLVTLYAVVDGVRQRFTDAQVKELLTLIDTTLEPFSFEEEDDDEEEEEEEGEGGGGTRGGTPP